jgi:hypothetical protein
MPVLLRELGVDPAVVLAAAGLGAGALGDPDNRVNYGSIGRMLQSAATATGHPRVGLQAGQLWHLADLGAVGELVRHSTTVGAALQAMVVHQQLNSGGGFTFAVKRAAVMDFGYGIYYPGVQGADHIYDCVLASAYNMMRELAGTGWGPTEVFLPHSKPRDTTMYRTVFKVVPRFNSEFTALRFPAYWLDRDVQGADPARRLQAAVHACVTVQDLDGERRQERDVGEPQQGHDPDQDHRQPDRLVPGDVGKPLAHGGEGRVALPDRLGCGEAHRDQGGDDQGKFTTVHVGPRWLWRARPPAEAERGRVSAQLKVSTIDPRATTGAVPGTARPSPLRWCR